MTDRKNITFFELKDETGRTRKKEGKKTRVETVFFKSETQDNQIPDADRKTLQSEIEEEFDPINEPNDRLLKQWKRGVFACPRFDRFFETGDAKIE